MVQIPNFQYSYLYTLLRYVPDLKRNEPLNFGIVVEKDREALVRLNTDFDPRDKRTDIDVFNKENLGEWIHYITSELETFQGQTAILFQLSNRLKIQGVQGQYKLSLPANIYFEEELPLEQVANQLYQELVL